MFVFRSPIVWTDVIHVSAFCSTPLNSKSLLGGPFDLVSRVSKVGYGGIIIGFLRDTK